MKIENYFKNIYAGDTVICVVSKSKLLTKDCHYLVLKSNGDYISIRDNSGKIVNIYGTTYSKFINKKEHPLENISYSDAVSLHAYCKSEILLFGENAYKSDVCRHYSRCVDILDIYITKKIKDILYNKF